MRPITVAFFDDHPIFLAGLCQLFSSGNEFSVVAVGKCGHDIEDIARNVRPDLIVIDLNMPGSVLESVAKVANMDLNTRIVVFTASTDIEAAISVFEAGATGYVMKDSSLDDLRDALRQVHAGETYMTPRLAAKVIAGLRQPKAARRAPRVSFSKREEDVLALLLRGATNKAMAEKLVLSEKTIKHYMTILIQKLEVNNRVEVVLAAQELAKSGALSRTCLPH